LIGTTTLRQAKTRFACNLACITSPSQQRHHPRLVPKRLGAPRSSHPSTCSHSRGSLTQDPCAPPNTPPHCQRLTTPLASPTGSGAPADWTWHPAKNPRPHPIPVTTRDRGRGRCRSTRIPALGGVAAAAAAAACPWWMARRHAWRRNSWQSATGVACPLQPQQHHPPRPPHQPAHLRDPHPRW